MKVKTISRSPLSISRECPGDLRMVHRNIKPSIHPHQRAREYTRAVTASKLSQMFAKPFLGQLERGHNDGVNCSALKREHLAPFLSGGVDGEVRIWDLNSRKCLEKKSRAHSGLVNGLVFCREEGGFLSCGQDGYVRRWALPDFSGYKGAEKVKDEEEDGLIQSWRHAQSSNLTSIDHHWESPNFATASSSSVDIWSYQRSSPIQSHIPSSFRWGDATITHLKYNQAQTDLIGYTSSDRGVGLIDTRASQPLSKTVLTMNSNAIEFNPMEPMNFVVANEDHNAYLFDMRKLDSPVRMYKGHVGPVLCVSFSPTGRDFATAGYDSTIRLFHVQHGASRDMYHLKRMQIVRTVNYTMDAKYILSGSDDTNIRLWKAYADQPIGQTKLREDHALQYRQALVKKYSHMHQVRKITKKTHNIPNFIRKKHNLDRIQKESRDRKFDNVVKHSKPGSVHFLPDKDKVVVKKVD